MAANPGEAVRPDRVQFIYTQSPDYRVLAANGAYGGPTPAGDIMVEFYCERQQPPMIEEHRLDPQGRPGQKLHGPGVSSDVPQLERYVQFGILLSPRSAEAIGKWLIEKAAAVARPGSEPGV